ncbi:MAG TPA: GWxTD domain-containing protein [Acidobacteriota bacterium]|nr:GWxTD domain-containing protein [Acidobacteriota bacterium]
MLARLLPLLLLILALGAPAAAQDDDQRRQEESEDYFKKWLETDVKYIINDEEKDVFNSLTTPEEKEAFIEQFWFRRDPNPNTANNEFKEEHYRRIAFANERFQSGKPGWMTDRGRVYIIHGEPDYIERHPSGGSYQRPIQEGGTRTFTYPFEVWHYRHIEGMGGDISLEFVDNSFSGEYRLALRPEEKDMLLYISGTAPTIWELMRVDSGRIDRGFFHPGLERNAAWLNKHGYSSRDTPFARYSRFALATRAPDVKFPDLRQIVSTNLTYNELPFQVDSSYIRINDNQVLVPVAVQLENKDLTFELVNGVHQAKVNIYGVIRNMVGRLEGEFEETVVAEYPPNLLQRGLQIKSLYQKNNLLEAGRRYRLDVVVKDQNSNRAGVLQTGLIVPRFDKEQELMASSLILSKIIEPAPVNAKPDDLFVIGDLKVWPNLGDSFYEGEELGSYMQVYNIEQDQATQLPDVSITYSLQNGKGEVVKEVEERNGDAIQYFSPYRMVLVRHIPLTDLPQGTYNLSVKVKDHIGERVLEEEARFEIIPLPETTQ